MTVEIFLRGIVVGLTASITLGPVGVMCIQRTLSKKRESGFVSGLGAATADTLFATPPRSETGTTSSAIRRRSGQA